MAKRRISEGDGIAALRAVQGGSTERQQLATAVRFLLEELAALAPGNSVEVRVPPWAAVQVGVPGATSVHRRGTPQNVVEMDAATWLALDDGTLSWADAVAAHLKSLLGDVADVAVVDINDIGGNILGSTLAKAAEQRLVRILGANPLGQGHQSTPLGIIRPA